MLFLEEKNEVGPRGEWRKFPPALKEGGWGIWKKWWKQAEWWEGCVPSYTISGASRRVSLPLPFNDLEVLRENADQLVQGSMDTSFPQHQDAKLTAKSICNNLCLQDVGYSPCKGPQRHAVSYRKSPLWMWHQSWDEDWDPHVSRSPPSLGSWDNVSSSFPPPEQIATLPRPLLKWFATLTVPREAAEEQKAEKQRMQRTNGPGRLQGMKQASASERLLRWPLPQPLACCHSF